MRYRDELKMSFTKISPIESADGYMMKISLKSHALFHSQILRMGLRWTSVKSTVESADGSK